MGARALVVAAVVASATMRVVATASLLPRIAMSTPAGVDGVVRVTVEAATLMHQDRGTWPTTSLHLVH